MKEMYLAEGFDDYLSKPINVQELDRVVNKFFK
jgi:DNA-binding response OmpR family regulator